MRTRRAIAAAAATTLLAGCGGTDGTSTTAQEVSGSATPTPTPTATAASSAEDVAALAKLATDVLRAKNATKYCTTLITKEFRAEVYRSAATCRSRHPQASYKGKVALSDVAVDGDTATATATIAGGVIDGAVGQWEFHRDAAGWRLDLWSTEYLRSAFLADSTAVPPRAGFAPSAAKQLLRCSKTEAKAMPDDDLRALVLGTYHGDLAPVQDLVLFCMTKSENGKPSPLRTQFESNMRKASEGVTEKEMACVLTRLRKAITDVELLEAGLDPSGKAQRKLDRATDAAALQCGVRVIGARAVARAATRAVPAVDAREVR